MTLKLLHLLKLLLEEKQPKYLVKVDDDVYLQVPRLPHAMQRWQQRNAGMCCQNQPLVAPHSISPISFTTAQITLVAS